MKTKMAHWNGMYELSTDKIPWEIINPPKELVELIENKIIISGKALDVGCGTGNYSIYLAKNGFDVTGVDFSQKAIETARDKAKQNKVDVKFVKTDVTELSRTIHQTYDFILDYSLLHHIPLSETAKYTSQFLKLLKLKGKLLLVCYSDKDKQAYGEKIIKGKYGNSMYYRTALEIRRAYKGLKEVYYKYSSLGKKSQHLAHCFLFEK